MKDHRYNHKRYDDEYHPQEPLTNSAYFLKGLRSGWARGLMLGCIIGALMEVVMSSVIAGHLCVL